MNKILKSIASVPLIFALALGMLFGNFFELKDRNDKQIASLGVFENDFPEVSATTATSTSGDPRGIEVLPTNFGRKYGLIINDSLNVIYLQKATTTSADPYPSPNNGIRLNASGGSYEITTLNMFTGAIWATSTTAGGGDVILITESK